MGILSTILVIIVALLHLGFLILEMFYWQKPLGLKIFKLTPSFAAESAVLAANQGLYNGFLVAGLVWALIVGLNGNDILSFQLKVFFLSCVFIAGIYGSYSANMRIFFVQGLPALLALVMLFIAK